MLPPRSPRASLGVQRFRVWGFGAKGLIRSGRGFPK